VVIENKPGAGGNIASDMVAHSDPDGYTIFIVGPGLATNQFLYPQLSYDPVGDFAPVTLLITQPNMMCVPNSSPAKSVQEFIAYCNENRGKVTYASSGNGTTLHLSGELFKRLANVEMTHIPYRGGAPAINDLISAISRKAASTRAAGVVTPWHASPSCLERRPIAESRLRFRRVSSHGSGVFVRRRRRQDIHCEITRHQSRAIASQVRAMRSEHLAAASAA